MHEVIKEYGAAAIAALGGILFLGIIGNMMLSQDGLVAQLISLCANGGC